MKLGIDGYTNAGEIQDEGCCPPDICSISETSLVCNFINLLPTGPMWDVCKQRALQGSREVNSSLVLYAMFVAKVFKTHLHTNLWPALRESDPYTAATTLDEWLERLQWVDCYSICRNRYIVELSPLEVMGVCGPLYCGPEYEDVFERALKSAIVQALWRARLQPVYNIASLNAVLEPLGVTVEANLDAEDLGCDREEYCLTIKPSRDWMLSPNIECSNVPIYTTAYVDMTCDAPAGLPAYVWPNVMAAECITRAVLPKRKLCLDVQYCKEPTQHLQDQWGLEDVVFAIRFFEGADGNIWEVVDHATLRGSSVGLPDSISDALLNTVAQNNSVELTGQMAKVPTSAGITKWVFCNRFKIPLGSGNTSYSSATETLTLQKLTTLAELVQPDELYCIVLAR